MTALIPIIKKKRPDAKIIFRSHIQSTAVPDVLEIFVDGMLVQSDLTDDPNTAQYRTWNYLFNFVKDVDLFLAVSC